eukprot:5092385-Alexandrium_andersonii.AAC.1
MGNFHPLIINDSLQLTDNALPARGEILQQDEEDREQMAKDAQGLDLLQENELHRRRDAGQLEAMNSRSRSRSPSRHR